MDLQVTWGGQCPSELLTQVGEWLERLGDSTAALHYYAAALAADTDWSLAAYRAGSLLARLNRPAEAAEYLKRAVALTADHAPSWYLASKVSLSCGHASEALEQARRVLALDSNHVGAALVALRSHAVLQQWDEIVTFRAEHPGVCLSAEARLACALALCRTGALGRAQELWGLTTGRDRRRFRSLAEAVEQCLAAPASGDAGAGVPLQDKGSPET